MIGEAAALGSAALWAVSTVVVKSTAGRLGAFYITALRTGFAAALGCGISLLLFRDLITLDIPSSTMAVLIGGGLVATLGDTALIRAVAVEDVSRAFTVSTSFYIVLSVIGSAVFAEGSISVLLLLGGAGVLAGTHLILNDRTNPIQRARGRPVGQEPLIALGLCIFASLSWSFHLLIVADAMKSVDPVAATVLRLPFMTLALAAVAGIRGDVRRYTLQRQDLIAIGASGALVLGAMLLFLLAAKSVSPGTVAVLTSTSPIFVVPLAHVFLKEAITVRIVSGIAVSMAGVWLTIL